MGQIKRAILSVTDKTGLVDFARGLRRLGIPLIASGGTAKAIREADQNVEEVSSITGFPEIFGGRVKTMHPLITGGILMRRDNESDQREAEANGIEPIDLVAVNLYDFGTAVKKGLPVDKILEEIDIGGPTLIRSAAKNHKHVLIVVDPTDYDFILKLLQDGQDIPLSIRRKLAHKAFKMTAVYDNAIDAWFDKIDGQTD